VELDDGILCEPSVVLHTFSCLREAAGIKSIPLRFIDRAAHSYVERPGEDSDVLIIWVGVWRDLVTIRYFEADDVQALFGGVPAHHNELSPFRKGGRREAGRCAPRPLLLGSSFSLMTPSVRSSVDYCS
jgi:hypothetical protein